MNVNQPTITHALLVVVSALSLWLAFGPAAPSPVVPVTPVAGPDLRGVFADRRQAAQAAALCEAFVRILEYDGQQPEPLYQSQYDAEDLRANLRRYQLLGGTYGPAFAERAAAWLETQIGTEPGEIARDKWIAAFRGLAAACRREAGG